MRVSPPDSTYIPVGTSDQTESTVRPLAVKDSIESRNSFSCFSFLSQLFNRIKTYIQNLFFKPKKTEEKPPEPLPSPLPLAIPVFKPIEEKKKEVLDDFSFKQGYDFKTQERYHLFAYKGKELFKLSLEKTILLEHIIHPEEVPCFIVGPADKQLKEIDPDTRAKIKNHILALLREEESRLMVKVRLVVTDYDSPLIEIMRGTLKLERKFKNKAKKELTIFKLE